MPCVPRGLCFLPGFAGVQHLTSFLTHHLCHMLQVQAVLQRKEEEDRQMQQLVQALQAALDTERQTVRSLKEQVRGQLQPRRNGALGRMCSGSRSQGWMPSKHQLPPRALLRTEVSSQHW